MAKKGCAPLVYVLHRSTQNYTNLLSHNEKLRNLQLT